MNFKNFKKHTLLTKKIAAPLLALAILVAPTFIFAQVSTDTGLVHCEGSPTAEQIRNGVKQCNFNTLIEGIQFLINWMIAIAIPLSVLVFAYAGVLYMTGRQEDIKKAKTMLPKVVWGIAIMCAAWLIVHAVLSALVKPNQGYTSLLK